MAILKFEPPKERAFLRVKIARDVQERVERYRAFCGAPKLADLVERAPVQVMDKDAGCRGQENGGAAIREENSNFLANALIANVGIQCGLQTYPPSTPIGLGFLQAFDIPGATGRI
jgi:hypothetical protein